MSQSMDDEDAPARSPDDEGESESSDENEGVGSEADHLELEGGGRPEAVAGADVAGGGDPAPDEPSDAEVSPHGVAPRRRSLRLVLVLVALAAAVALAIAVYRRIHRQPTAHRHVPAGATVALRADAVKIILFKPVREHLWPIVLRPGAKSPGAPVDQAEEASRIERFAELTGVRLPDDLREAIVAAVDPTSWVLLVGGTFRKGLFVDGIQQWLHEEGIGGWRRDGDLLLHALGPALGQAEDGTLVLATNRSVALAALPEAEPDVTVPLPIEGGVSFLITKRAWEGVTGMLPGSLPGLDALSRVERAHGSLLLSDSPRLEVTLVPREGVDAASLREDVERVITAAKTLTLLMPGDLGGAKQALRSAVVDSSSGGVEVSSPWPYEAFDRAAARIAARIRGQPDPTAEPERSWSIF